MNAKWVNSDGRLFYRVEGRDTYRGYIEVEISGPEVEAVVEKANNFGTLRFKLTDALLKLMSNHEQVMKLAEGLYRR